MINYRIIATGAAVAFVISLLSGIVGGVSLLVLLIRAVIAAVLFAAVIAGLFLVLDRFLPELSELFSSDRNVSAVMGGTGREGIDIVMPEDDLPEGLYTDNGGIEDDEPLADEVGEYTDDDVNDAPFAIRGTPETVNPPDLVENMDSLPDLECIRGYVHFTGNGIRERTDGR